jgi:hypothetical protein
LCDCSDAAVRGHVTDCCNGQQGCSDTAIYGPTRAENGYWRVETSQEINDILKGQNIIGFIK